MAATLKLDGCDTEFEVLQFSYSLHQPKDYKTGKVTDTVQANSLNLTVNAGGDTELAKWALSDTDQKSGSIEVSNFNGEGSERTLKFEGAFLTGFSESMSGNGKMNTTMEISFMKLDIDGEVIEKKW